MITQSMDYVPFDLKHLRCIVYEYKPGKIEKFERALERTVKTVLSGSRPPTLQYELTTPTLWGRTTEMFFVPSRYPTRLRRGVPRGVQTAGSVRLWRPLGVQIASM